MNDEPHRPDLEEALARYLEGEPEPGDGELIAREGSADPKLSRELSGLLMVDQLLRHDSEPETDAFVMSLQTRLAAQEEGGEFVQRLEETARMRAPRSRPLPWIVAAAACLLALVSWFRSPDPDPVAPSKDSGVIALLVDESGARYRKGFGPDHIRFGAGVYELIEGTAHIRLVNGIDLVVPAPVRFDLENPLTLSLEVGRLRVIVPEQARGFTVRTPSADFEDLGTEFGIGVDGRSGESELHVFQGQVDVLEREGEKKLASVVLGQSVRVVGGAVKPAEPPDPDAFPTPDQIGTLRWQKARERLRHDRDLVWYYPFIRDEADPARLRDHAAEGPAVHGKIHGARWVTGRWPGKQALLFDRDGDAVLLDVPGKFDALTLAGWIKVDRLDHVLNAVFDSDGWEDGDLHLQLNRHGQLLFGPYSESRKLRLPEAQIPLGKWTHVAVTLDREAGRAVSYVNGREDGSYAVSKDGLYAPGASRIGDWLRRPDYKHVLQRTFAGRIDEMALWRRVLTPGEIAHLAEEGRPALLADGPTQVDRER